MPTRLGDRAKTGTHSLSGTRLVSLCAWSLSCLGGGERVSLSPQIALVFRIDNDKMHGYDFEENKNKSKEKNNRPKVPCTQLIRGEECYFFLI